MKHYTAVMFAALVIGAMTIVVAEADQQVLKLEGGLETPAVTTKASGVATLVVKADGSVSGGITTSGIDGTAAHIHLGDAGASGPPIITLQRAGSDQWLVPDGTKLTTDQYAAFRKGALYVNVHSKAHPSGELRAQLQAPAGN